MKLDWEINNCRVLVAKVGEVTYHVAPDVISLWKPKKYSTVSEGKVEAEGAVYGMSLTNAIAWCERDAECPAQPPAADPVAPKMAGEMSKFPSTMDAKEWAAGFVKEGVEPQDYLGVGSEGALVTWFQAALSHGSREGYQSRNEGRAANLLAEVERANKAEDEVAKLKQECSVLADELAFYRTAMERASSGRGGLRQRVVDLENLLVVANNTIQYHFDRAERMREEAQRSEAAFGPEWTPVRDPLLAESLCPSTQAPEPSSGEEQIENLAWGLKNEMKRAAERDNEIAERLGACEARLTQLVASKCQALDHRINSAVAPINRELGELRALVQELPKLRHRVRCAQGESAKVRGKTNERLLVVERKLRELMG